MINFDLEVVREAVSNRGMFNIIHYETAFKIDFIIRKRGRLLREKI